jgi:hypothetical protein
MLSEIKRCPNGSRRDRRSKYKSGRRCRHFSRSPLRSYKARRKAPDRATVIRELYISEMRKLHPRYTGTSRLDKSYDQFEGPEVMRRVERLLNT